MSSSTSYPVNGTSALRPRAYGFTVYEGGSNHGSFGAAEEPVPQNLTFMQSLKAIAAVALVLAALGITLVLSNRGSQAAFESSFAQVPTTTITVHSGDSLWDIACDHAPQGCSTASVVRWISQQNNLDSALIVAGQTLVVPAP